MRSGCRDWLSRSTWIGPDGRIVSIDTDWPAHTCQDEVVDIDTVDLGAPIARRLDPEPKQDIREVHVFNSNVVYAVYRLTADRYAGTSLRSDVPDQNVRGRQFWQTYFFRVVGIARADR